MFAFPQPHYMACLDCGASVARGEAEAHACDPERRAEFLMLRWRGELARLEEEFSRYLESPRGQFDEWYAARRR